jgi:hypothetical protein
MDLKRVIHCRPNKPMHASAIILAGRMADQRIARIRLLDGDCKLINPAFPASVPQPIPPGKHDEHAAFEMTNDNANYLGRT